jgi:hypothetical protein
VEIGSTTSNSSNWYFTTGLTQVYRGTETSDGFIPTANSVNTLSFEQDQISALFMDGVSNIVNFHGAVCQVL